jgi:hypothetical protein
MTVSTNVMDADLHRPSTDATGLAEDTARTVHSVGGPCAWDLSPVVWLGRVLIESRQVDVVVPPDDRIGLAIR